MSKQATTTSHAEDFPTAANPRCALLWSQPLWPALAVIQRKAKTGPEDKLWIKGWTRLPRPRKWPAEACNLGLMWYKYSTGKCTWHAMSKSPSTGIAINHVPKAFNFQPQNYFHSIKQLLSSTAPSSYNLCSFLPVSLSSSPYRQMDFGKHLRISLFG